MRAGLALSLIVLVLPLAGAHADPLADFYQRPQRHPHHRL